MSIRYFLLFVFFLCTLMLSASDFTVKNEDGIAISYSLLSKTECEVTHASECSVLVIPSKVTYMGHELTVTRLAKYACGGWGSYWNNQLQSVYVPNTVTEIGEFAFGQNSALNHVELPDKLEKIKQGTFYGCHNLKSIDLPDSIKDIANLAFSGCSMTEIKLPKNLESIGDGAFTSLETVYIPKNVNNISYDSFGTQLKSIVVADDNPYLDSRDNCNAIIETKSNRLILRTETTSIPSDVVAIGGKVYYGAKITKLSLPSSIKTIESSAFQSSSLEEVDFSEGLETIDDGAFCDCSSLANLSLPNSLVSIGTNAFMGCKSLSEVLIPENVVSVGDNAFSDCDDLVSVTISSQKTKLGKSVFANSTCFRVVKIESETPPIAQENTFATQSGFIMKNLVVPQGSKDLYSLASVWSKFWNIYDEGETIKYLEGDTVIVDDLKYIVEKDNIARVCGAKSQAQDLNIPLTIADGVQEYTTKLENTGVFAKNERIRTLIAPGVLRFEHFNEGSFYNCTNLEYVECQNLEDIAGGWGTSNHYCAFANCANLKTLIMPKLKSIGDLSFVGCGSIEMVVFPNLEIIGGGAFKGCQKIHTIDLPKLQYIGKEAFSGCTNIKKINVSNLKEINTPYIYRDCGTFEGCTLIKEIELPSIEIIYACTDYNGTSYSHGCFYGCESLEKILIGKNCTLIDGCAFGKCEKLKAIECLALTPPQLDERAFENTTYQSATLIVPQGCKSLYSSTLGWKEFSNIQETTTSAITQVTKQNGNLNNNYNLQGMKVQKATKGIIIKNKKKIYVK